MCPSNCDSEHTRKTVPMLNFDNEQQVRQYLDHLREKSQNDSMERMEKLLEKYGWDSEERCFREAPDVRALQDEFQSVVHESTPDDTDSNAELGEDSVIADELLEALNDSKEDAIQHEENERASQDCDAQQQPSESNSHSKSDSKLDTEPSASQSSDIKSNDRSHSTSDTKSDANSEAFYTVNSQSTDSPGKPQNDCDQQNTPKKSLLKDTLLSSSHQDAHHTLKSDQADSSLPASDSQDDVKSSKPKLIPHQQQKRKASLSKQTIPIGAMMGSSNSTSPSSASSMKKSDDQPQYEDSSYDDSADYITYGEETPEAKIKTVNQYILGEKLGSGTYGKVVEAIDSKSLKRVAIKIMKRLRLKKIKGAEERLKNEILINQKLKHPNVIEFYEVIHDEQKGKIYLVIEFAGAGSLSQVIDSQSNQRLSLDDVHHFFRQLIRGLEYIHSQGVVHLDIKPDNLMISPDRVLKISDFGVSVQFKLFEGDRCKIFHGTPSFASPEIAKGDTFSGEKADIWACGVTLYYLITGEYPFKGESVFQLYENVVKGEYKMPDYIPNDLQDLLQKLLEPDEHKRLSASQVKQHPWYLGDDREEVGNREPLVDRWRSFSLSQTISKALHNSNLYHMSFKVDGSEPSDLKMSDIEREKCSIL